MAARLVLAAARAALLTERLRTLILAYFIIEVSFPGSSLQSTPLRMGGCCVLPPVLWRPRDFDLGHATANTVERSKIYLMSSTRSPDGKVVKTAADTPGAASTGAGSADCSAVAHTAKAATETSLLLLMVVSLSRFS